MPRLSGCIPPGITARTSRTESVDTVVTSVGTSNGHYWAPFCGTPIACEVRLHLSGEVSMLAGTGEYEGSSAHSLEIERGERFGFGDNWLQLFRLIDEK